jgi:uncharacterized membrane protein
MPANAHTTDIETFAECQATGGVVTSIQMMTFPVQTQTRCEINGHIYTEGSDRIIEVSTNGNRDGERLNQDERESFLTTLQERREGVTDARAELRAENRANAALSVNVQARIENFANGLFDALERALIRLENAADRIENKIDEFSARGHDLGAEAEMLAEARLSIEASETEVAEANLALEVMLSSENPREELPALRTALGEAKDAIRTTQQELMQIVQSIRLVVEAEAEVEASN